MLAIAEMDLCLQDMALHVLLTGAATDPKKLTCCSCIWHNVVMLAGVIVCTDLNTNGYCGFIFQR